MKRRAAVTSAAADALTRKVAIAALSTVSSETPLDTGRARSNWLVGLGAPRREMIPTFGKEVAASTALALGMAVISGYRKEQAIYITNNLPYIRRLNDGWSAQAPSGYVETAVMVAVRTLVGTRLVVEIPAG